MIARRAFGPTVVVGAMLLAAALGLAGLDNQAFWDDEANTAIYARNLLRFGRLTAWDGTNLLGYAQGGSLGEDLGQELRVPPLPAYVAALGMWLLGETTVGGRVMFVLAGVTSVGLLAVWMRRYFGRQVPWYWPSLILALSPAFLLYARNCRYYALGVLFSTLVWTIWTPGAPSLRLPRGVLLSRTLLLRYAGGAVAVVLLLLSQYLNAAAVLSTLPLFFVDRRFRRPSQYVLLGVMYGAAAVYGLWALCTANPFAAEYQVSSMPVAPASAATDYWTHTYQNFLWYLRDVGTHEFFPWCLAPVLVLPWAASWTRRLRPAARRGATLVMLLVGYLLVAALLTPADMGKGPTAEVRYVVPLVAVGSAVGGLALVILWRLAWPLAPAAFLVLVGSNVLHLGFLAVRDDGTNPSWPPTLYRYLVEVRHDYQTGNEALIELLARLPAGTTVRLWPPHLVYPPMFYVPKLRYCDQLSEMKPIRPELRGELPDYLFVERARPEVVVAAAPHALEEWERLRFRYGRDAYRVQQTIAPFWNFIFKPEVPNHFFSPPPGDWAQFPGFTVLVRHDEAVARDPALASDPHDAEALYRLGLALSYAKEAEPAKKYLAAALRIEPNHSCAHFQLGVLCMEEGNVAEAMRHFRAAIELDPQYYLAHVDLGTALQGLNRLDEARDQYLIALRLKPQSAVACFNLGNLARLQPGGDEEAIAYYRLAVKHDPSHAKAHVNWGSILSHQGKIAEAIEHFRAAVQISPNMFEPHVNLALALDAQGDRKRAIAELRTALGLIPADRLEAQQVGAKLREWGVILTPSTCSTPPPAI